jgi:hypothetical protein
MAWFWWFYAMVFGTWIVAMYRRAQRLCQAETATAGGANPTTTAMKPGMRVATILGTNLMLFWCVILLAWTANDRITAGVSVGVMLALSAWHLVRGARRGWRHR